MDVVCGKNILHSLRQNSFFNTILEGKTKGKRRRGRSKRSYVDQVKEKTGVVSYQGVKEISHKR